VKITREPGGQRVGMESVRDKCGIIKVDANLKRRARTHVCRVFKLLRDFWVLFEERRTWIEMILCKLHSSPCRCLYCLF